MALSQTIARLAQIKAAIRAALEEKLLRDPGRRFADYAPLIRNFWKPELNLADTTTLQAIVDGDTVTFKFSQTEAAGVAVDWGDGTAVETSDATGEVTLSHTYEYPTARHKIQARVVSGEATVASPAFGQDPRVYELALVQSFGYANYAFASIHTLERVAIIGNSWAVPDMLFAYCNKLRELVLSVGGNSIGSIKSVGIGAFLQTRLYGQVIDIYAPNGQRTTIKREAFRDSWLLGVAPGELETLENGAFYECRSLRFFSPSHVSGIGYLGTITSIPVNCFYNCLVLVQVHIPESVQRIEAYAFFGCVSLNEIDIPAAVNYIGDGAFYGCNSFTGNPVLGVFKIRATTPPNLASNALPEHIPAIYVPAESVDAYKAATNWNAFADRIFAIEE